ncbi:hypothetical protein [Mycoplasma seminis]|uniref:Lipoprotein n=1 Tax=Mycoplasma seminis TaxID=512749 RepID=A0ABY9HBV0_9MOLU|nr:hypothetical protein [Mycoplasma seminis]WLP85679.1 hypothetical protein Q8852_00780 [Mycoplasma seminis]
MKTKNILFGLFPFAAVVATPIIATACSAKEEKKPADDLKNPQNPTEGEGGKTNNNPGTDNQKSNPEVKKEQTTTNVTPATLVAEFKQLTNELMDKIKEEPEKAAELQQQFQSKFLQLVNKSKDFTAEQQVEFQKLLKEMGTGLVAGLMPKMD